MKITSCDTFTATIYIGTSHTGHGILYKGRDICQKYCDAIGLCVSFTETTFIYTGGNEAGLIVGLMNYPRFPKREEEIRDTAITLAKLLKAEYDQKRCSVVFPDKTIMLGEM